MTQPRTPVQEDLSEPPSTPSPTVDQPEDLVAVADPTVATPDDLPPDTTTDDQDTHATPTAAETSVTEQAESDPPDDDDQPAENEQPDQDEQEAPPPPGQDFTKVVIFLQASTTLISVQRNETDPKWLTTNDTDIDQALARVPTFLEEAEKQWAAEPMYSQPQPSPKTRPAPTPPTTKPHPPEKNKAQAPLLL